MKFTRILAIILAFVLMLGFGVFADEDTIVFEESFGNDLKNWEVVRGKGFSVQQSQLFYNNFSNGLASSVLVSRNDNFDNYDLETEFTPVSGGNMGVFVRLQDINSHYLLRVYLNTGRFLLLKKVNGGSYSEIKSANRALNANAVYRLGITLNGTEISVFLNDEPLFSVNDSSIRSGKVGFEGFNASFRVNNIKLIKRANTTYTEIVEEKEDIFEAAKEEKLVYVSPDGNDRNEGTAESPLATMDAARRKANNLKEKRTPVTVIFKEGEYNFQSTVTLTADDSGAPNAPITYMAEEGANVVFTGSKKLDIDKLVPVTNSNMVDRLHPFAKDKVMQLNLREQGIPYEIVDFTSGLEVSFSANTPSIFLNNKRQNIARWPNTGYNLILDSTLGGQRRWDLNEGEGAIMSFSETTPLRWTQAEDLYLEGYFATEYAGEWAKIKSIDTENLKLHFDNWTQYGVKKDYRWAAVNLLEEIDIPGEWYMDKRTMTLYYYPPYQLDSAVDSLEIATLTDAFVRLNNASYIQFKGLNFKKNTNLLKNDKHQINWFSEGGNGVTLNSCKFINIEDCEFENIGRVGIYLMTSTDITVNNNRLYNIGVNGIFINNCGDRATLTHSNVIIKNNEIYRVSVAGKNMDSHCIRLYRGVGTVIENNILHGAITAAIVYEGNEHVIRYNEMYNLLRSMADAGVVYAGRNWSEYGNVIEYNYIHHFGDAELADAYATNGTFWDDLHSGNTFRYNIVHPGAKLNTSGIKMGGGRDNTIIGNTVVDANIGVIAEDRTSGKPAGSAILDDGYVTLNQIPYNQPPFTTKYPTMGTIYTDLAADDNIWIPVRNNISNNLFVDVSKEHMTSAVVNNGTVENNVTLNDYSIFVDPDNQDFRVKNSAKREFSIPNSILDESFDLNKIGIQTEIKETNAPFKLLFPPNNESDIERQYVQLVWEEGLSADEYTYYIATDDQFRDIVVQGTTLETIVKIEGLRTGATYYWKVIAKNISRQMGKEWESESGVFKFTTAQSDTLEKTGLEKKIKEALEVLETMVESDNAGDFMPGSKAGLQALIKEAEAIINITTGNQDQIDSAYAKLAIKINTLDSLRTVAYATLDDFNSSSWRSTNSDVNVTLANDTLTVISDKASANVALDKKLSNQEILCFQTKLDSFGGSWAGYALRSQDIKEMPYRGNSYLVVIKEDLFELQNGGMLETRPNDGIFKEGSWHEIQYGAVTTEKGVNVIFKVDGKTIFDFLDNQRPVYEQGSFSIIPHGSNNPIQVKASAEVPEGLFELSREMQAQLSGSVETVYTTGDPLFATTGSWSDSNVNGYESVKVKTSVSNGATAKWLVEGEGRSYYRIFYWNSPRSNGDKNVAVRIWNYGGEYTKTIDLSQGEEGFVELGSYQFITERADYGDMNIMFTGSGSGEIGVSAIKIQRVVEGASSDKTLAVKIGSDKAVLGDRQLSMADAVPAVVNSRTLVPLRFVSEALDCNVDWNNETSTAIINGSIEFTIDNNFYSKNGTQIEIDQPAILMNSKTMVPFRAIAEALSKKVYYDEKRSIILVADEIDEAKITEAYLDDLDGRLQ